MKRLLTLLSHTLMIGLLLFAPFSHSASSIMIWPIDPVLEDKDKSTMIWLENNYTESVYVQVRILGWQQQNDQDTYSEQNDISISPPFAQIQPGKRQLIRLIKNSAIPEGTEKAYRILIDEIPQTSTEKEQANQVGVQFAMRYSIPLFSSGKSIWTKQDYNNPRDLTQATAPQLTFKVVKEKGKKWLEVTNTGVVHARISGLRTVSSTRSTMVGDGLVGYVLANSRMRLLIPANAPISNGSHIEAMINHNQQPVVIKPAK